MTTRATVARVMSRHPRLDTPNTLHYAMVRGTARTARCRADIDRADFGARGARWVEQEASTGSSCARVSNRGHRRAGRGLPAWWSIAAVTRLRLLTTREES